MKKITTEEIRDLFNRVMIEEISFSEMVDVINERVSEADKPCVENIPKCKFKKGDKVMLKSGYQKADWIITHLPVSPYYIDKPLTVVGYIRNGYICLDELIYSLPEDWLEPCVEELKKGDLAIFWNGDKRDAAIRIYERFNGGEHFTHRDHQGINWKNAIRYKSKEQYEKLIKGEI